MNIAIVGAGASGLYSAILIQRKHPDYSVVVFEKETKIGRKLFATGNGHCNLLNRLLTPDHYSHPDFLAPLLARYPYSVLLACLHGLGIQTLEEGDYVYPLSYSAATYVGLLEKLARQSGVRFYCGVRVVDYQKGKTGFALKFDQDKGDLPRIFDKILFCVGGASTPKLGSDGKSLSLLHLHGYSLLPLEPALAPVRVVHPERIKGLSGYRHHAQVSLFSARGELLYQESGEVLFKEDGLSGIVIFNVESVYLRRGKPAGAYLQLNLFPDVDSATLLSQLQDAAEKNPTFYADAFFPPEVQAHFHLVPSHAPDAALVSLLQGERFEIKDTYGFDNSQVSHGGVSLSEVTPCLESRREPGLYFLGEVLDVDGDCGGYNLAWALLSALIVGEVL